MFKSEKDTIRKFLYRLQAAHTVEWVAKSDAEIEADQAEARRKRADDKRAADKAGGLMNSLLNDSLLSLWGTTASKKRVVKLNNDDFTGALTPDEIADLSIALDRLLDELDGLDRKMERIEHAFYGRDEDD